MPRTSRAPMKCSSDRFRTRMSSVRSRLAEASIPGGDATAMSSSIGRSAIVLMAVPITGASQTRTLSSGTPVMPFAARIADWRQERLRRVLVKSTVRSGAGRAAVRAEYDRGRQRDLADHRRAQLGCSAQADRVAEIAIRFQPGLNGSRRARARCPCGRRIQGFASRS